MSGQVSFINHNEDGYPVDLSKLKPASDIDKMVEESTLFSNESVQAHPQWFRNGDLHMTENGMKVKLVFVKEGAGHRNSLGYYVYDTCNPPASPLDIQEVRIVWPNASAVDSDGSFQAGDSIELAYQGITDPDTRIFTPTHFRFPKNTSIGWVLVADGWNGSIVDYENATKFYSFPNFNPEANPEKRFHFVPVLSECIFGSILYGVEDLNREGECDDDFDDLVFMVQTLGTCGISKHSFGSQTWDGSAQGPYSKHRDHLLWKAIRQAQAQKH